MLLQVIEGKFSVCKVENLRAVNFNVPWLFVGKTDAEIRDVGKGWQRSGPRPAAKRCAIQQRSAIQQRNPVAQRNPAAPHRTHDAP